MLNRRLPSYTIASLMLSATAAAQSARDLAARLPVTLKPFADAYLAAAPADSSARYSSLSRLQNDSAGVDFVVAVLQSDPHPYVRRTIVTGAVYREAAASHGGFRALILRLVETDPDPSIVSAGVLMLQQLQAKDGLRALGVRFDALKKNGQPIPAALARDQQVLLDRSLNVNIPAFMRVPPPKFTALPSGRPIRVLAFGDWSTTQKEQYEVAKAIRAFHAKTPFDMGITLGDNFYSFPRPDRPDHPRWIRDYENEYGVMGIPIYVALGNHDYDVPDQIAAEVLYTQRSKTWKFPATYYTYTAGDAQFFVLDGYDLAEEMLVWFRRELAASTARWKIAYNHYPLRVAMRPIAGDSSENLYIMDMEGRAKPLVEIMKGKIDLYVAGHQHAMEHLKPREGINLLTAGSGGRFGYPSDSTNPIAYYANNQNGFLVLDISRAQIAARFIDVTGRLLYKTEFKK